MSLKNKHDAPRREVSIDNASLNLLMVILVIVILIIAILIAYFAIALSTRPNDRQEENGDKDIPTYNDTSLKQDIHIDIPFDLSDAKKIESVTSERAMLVDVTDKKIIASRKNEGNPIIYPASMTKVMSLIVMVENLPSESSLKDHITVTQEMYDRKVSEGHSGDFNTVGEVMTVEDALYAFILNSDGMMGIGLANYIAGSESAFVKLMNEKAEEMGLQNTLFQNCTGIYHKYHYTSCYDMAIIMAYAMRNNYCAKILSSEKYSTTTSKYTNGVTFYHDLLVTRFEKNPVRFNSVTVIAGKTGYAGSESGYCVVSYAKGNDGHFYVLVTANAEVKYEEINDMATIYNEFVE